MSKTLDKEKKKGGRKPLNLRAIRQIPIIADHLAVFEKSHPRRYYRYLRDLNQMFPAILKTFGTFDLFLESDENTKAVFFNEWAETQFRTRRENDKNGKLVNKTDQALKNSALNMVWMVQGFLGKLKKEYRANNENMDLILVETNLELPISMEDVVKLYDVFPLKLKLILKLMTFTGLNPADLVILTLADFKPFNGEFYYIQKLRQKTKGKNVQFLLLFHQEFYRELEAYATANNIDPKAPLFPMLPNTLLTEFRTYSEKFHLNPQLIPRFIRQLCFTALEEVLPRKLLDVWSQHKLKGVLDQSYIKETLNGLAKHYPQICEKVLIRSTYEYSKMDFETKQQSKINTEVVTTLKAVIQSITAQPPANAPMMGTQNTPRITTQSPDLIAHLEKLEALLDPKKKRAE